MKSKQELLFGEKPFVSRNKKIIEWICTKLFGVLGVCQLPQVSQIGCQCLKGVSEVNSFLHCSHHS